jgi:hypothetical protein
MQRLLVDEDPATTCAVLATLVWAWSCTASKPPRPDGAGGADAHTPDAYCLGPGQLDAVPAPIFEVNGCQHTRDTGPMLAVFTWTNRTGQKVAAPYGPANHVSPGAEAQGQPSQFSIAGGGRFAVPFDGSLATWTILGQSVSVSQASPDCGEVCGYFQLAGPDGFWVDTCTFACGDGVCDHGVEYGAGAESCQLCPTDCDCSSLFPLVDCVVPLDGGLKLVSFGYDNRGSVAVDLEMGPGNQLLPGNPLRGQPDRFEVGEHHSVFQVTYDGPDVTWMLVGKSATVGPDAPLCSQTCDSSCAGGTTCVAGDCRSSCGDGLCVEEDCYSCLDDCACAAPKVCSGGGCRTPPACGNAPLALRCGISEPFVGIHVDCGPCPEGQGCHGNHCSPLCPTP